MFAKNKKLMQGAKKFQDAGFDLTNVTKGKDAWKKFAGLMKDEEYI